MTVVLVRREGEDLEGRIDDSGEVSETFRFLPLLWDDVGLAGRLRGGRMGMEGSGAGLVTMGTGRGLAATGGGAGMPKASLAACQGQARFFSLHTLHAPQALPPSFL